MLFIIPVPSVKMRIIRFMDGWAICNGYQEKESSHDDRPVRLYDAGGKGGGKDQTAVIVLWI